MTRLPFLLLILPLQLLTYYVMALYADNPQAFDSLGLGLAKDSSLLLILVSILKLVEYILFRARLTNIGWSLIGAYLALAYPVLFIVAAMRGILLPGFAAYMGLYALFTLTLCIKKPQRRFI